MNQDVPQEKRKITCPVCDGEGRFEILDRTWHGDFIFKGYQECEECNGNGEYEVECD